jgi:hypothetical protein
VIVVAIGLLQGKEGLDSYRTGEPIHTYRHRTLEWWEQLPIAGLTVLFGLLVAAVGFGWVKPRGERPM